MRSADAESPRGDLRRALTTTLPRHSEAQGTTTTTSGLGQRQEYANAWEEAGSRAFRAARRPKLAKTDVCLEPGPLMWHVLMCVKIKVRVRVCDVYVYVCVECAVWAGSGP